MVIKLSPQLHDHSSSPLPSLAPSPRLVVHGLAQGLLTEHEVLSLARHYGRRQFPVLTTLARLIQDDLRKTNYTAFEALAAKLADSDAGGLGFVEPDLLRHVCHRAELPLSDMLIDGTIMK